LSAKVEILRGSIAKGIPLRSFAVVAPKEVSNSTTAIRDCGPAAVRRIRERELSPSTQGGERKSDWSGRSGGNDEGDEVGEVEDESCAEEGSDV
jgi:hypothetical protein